MTPLDDHIWTQVRPSDTTHLKVINMQPSQVDRICILIAIPKLSQRY